MFSRSGGIDGGKFVGPSSVAVPVATSLKTTDELTVNLPIASEDQGLEKNVVAMKNKRRLIKTFSGIFIGVMFCVITYSPHLPSAFYR